MGDVSKISTRSAVLVAKWTEQAEKAVKTADVASLRATLNEACQHNEKLSSAFDGLIQVYPQAGASRAESESAVAAMRDVALAAIELARSSFTKEIK